MSTIFGFALAQGRPLAPLVDALAEPHELSEAPTQAGLAVHCGDRIQIFAHERGAWSATIGGSSSDRWVALIGAAVPEHRLHFDPRCNLPIARGGLVGVHDGIVTNGDQLIALTSRDRAQLADTERVLMRLEQALQGGASLSVAVRQLLEAIEGTSALAVILDDPATLVLASNTDTLHYVRGSANEALFFSSDRHALRRRMDRLGGEAGMRLDEIASLPAHAILLADLATMEVTEHLRNAAPDPVIAQPRPNPKRLPVELSVAMDQEAIANLVRCSRCVLPETMPFIDFDEAGVCNFCRDYVIVPPKGTAALEEIADRHRSRNGEPDCIVALSGGRDSSYGLHYVKNVLKMNPLAYTYDWGMVTDLARRNQARLCGKLGIEHILISADIKQKRENIRQNVLAWLKRPRLGMVPIFMAGDKQYFYYANKLSEQTGIPLLIFCANAMEKTHFKTGFAGLHEQSRWFNELSILKKVRLAAYYGTEFLANPRYFNRSFADTLFAFYSSFVIDNVYLELFDYLPWDESSLMDTIRREYNWELAGDTDSSWRIGDGTAAFYNYIYYSVAGFSEHDTFRSNQIREGRLDRATALELVQRDNAPRFESIREYAELIRFDYVEALRVINGMPKLYPAKRLGRAPS